MAGARLAMREKELGGCSGENLLCAEVFGRLG